MYRPKKKEYPLEEIVAMEDEMHAEIFGGPKLTKPRTLEILEAQAHGAFSEGRQEFESEAQMYKYLTTGIDKVTPQELKKFMQRAEDEPTPEDKTMKPEDGALATFAKSQNMTVPEFKAMMKSEHNLVPPDGPDDEPDDDDGPDDEYDYSDYYTPPKRGINPSIIPAEDCEQPIADLREQMLNPELDRYDLDKLAQMLAQFVSASGELEDRITEITENGPYENEDATFNKAMYSEVHALVAVQNDKELTAQAFGESSAAMAVSAMSGHKTLGQPIDMLTLKDEMEAQMKALADSGVSRQDKMAMLALLSQKAGEALMTESASALTGEAKAMILKGAVSNFATSAKITEQLHNLNSPTGTIVDHVGDKQLPNETKKLGRKKK